MRVYLSGPMRGYPDWNACRFESCRNLLTNLGHMVFCPHLVAQAMPYRQSHDDEPTALRHVIQQDMACLYAAEAIALIQGWEASVGATVELAMAQFLSLAVLCAETGNVMHVSKTPWIVVRNYVRGN